MAEKEHIERILTVRKHLQTLAEICENEDINIEASREATYLLENTNLADGIAILNSAWPGYLRPNIIKGNLERSGQVLLQVSESAIHNSDGAQRMVESGEVKEGIFSEDGKKT